MSIAAAASAPPADIIGRDFRNILFATDFSPCSEACLPFVRVIADRYAATVHVVHVVGEETLLDLQGVPHCEVEEGQIAAAQLRMDELTQSDVFRDILFTRTIATGQVWQAVCQLSSELHIDLLILGTHGRRGLKHVLAGSVAEQVLRRATCPVLTVGPELHKKGLARGRMDVVLYATDFSAASLQALDYAVSLARTYFAELVLVHAVKISGMMVDDDFVAEVKPRLEELMTNYPDVDFQTLIDSGPADELILAAATETKADLIVMGAHGGASIAAHTPWLVAHAVVSRAPCPVLTVRGE